MTSGVRLIALAAFIIAYVSGLQTISPAQEIVQQPAQSVPLEEVGETIAEHVAVLPQAPAESHMRTPDPLRAIYLTGWSAGTATRLQKALALIDASQINAVVIDIKDATGRLSYQPKDQTLIDSGVGTNRIRDLQSVIDAFHSRGVYVIGRLSVFQDPYFAKLHPEETLHDTRSNLPWTDYKGISWLRVDSDVVRRYIVSIAQDAYAQGFDEINVDYVRFPSDGPLKYIDLSGFAKDKAHTLEDFFIALRSELPGIPLSADVFGLTMSARDDVGIGQKAVLIAPHVDYLAPMVYPSHFWNGSYGIPVPAAEPYKVIYTSLSDGMHKLQEAGIDTRKLRPWLQDFDLVGVHYDAAKVRAQIDAAHALGIDSWMMWDPRNEYTDEVYTAEPEVGLTQ